jgi:ribonuclease E
MFMPTVTLRSGGYIVINQTEALVSIDVNSGKATREHSIEDTAYKTNLEAAEEIGRQLRLRDLAGLIVIDFIDMEDARNDRNVEKRLRDFIKNDRARVQIGKISQFGLLEMSRQRLRAGVVAGSTVPCPHCGGQGIVRSVESTALRLLRGLEEEAQRRRATALGIRAPTEVAIYALNQKRREIARIESEHGLTVQFEARDGMLAGTFEIDRIAHRAPDDRAKLPPLPEPPVPEPKESVLAQPADLEIEEQEAELQPPADAQPAAQSGKRRRRRRRGRDRTTGSPAAVAAATVELATSPERKLPEPSPSPAIPSNDQTGDTNPAGEQPRKRRRRRRGRRGPREDVMAASQNGAAVEKPAQEMSFAAPNASGDREMPVPAPQIVPNAPSQPVWSLSRDEAHGATVLVPAKQVKEENMQAPERALAEITSIPPQTAAQPEPEKSAEPARKGWWQRPFRSRE